VADYEGVGMRVSEDEELSFSQRKTEVFVHPKELDVDVVEEFVFLAIDVFKENHVLGRGNTRCFYVDYVLETDLRMRFSYIIPRTEDASTK
jgi:hypothetical protein